MGNPLSDSLLLFTCSYVFRHKTQVTIHSKRVDFRESVSWGRKVERSATILAQCHKLMLILIFLIHQLDLYTTDQGWVRLLRNVVSEKNVISIEYFWINSMYVFRCMFYSIEFKERLRAYTVIFSP